MLTQHSLEGKEDDRIIWCHKMKNKSNNKLLPINEEALAITRSLQYCKYWLKDCPEARTHTNQPLSISTFNSIYPEDTPHELNFIVINTKGFNFKVVHVKSKLDRIVDYLSRTHYWKFKVKER